MSNLTTKEKALLNLDEGLWMAANRFALGLAVVPLTRLLDGGGHSDWLMVAVAAGLLFLLRLGPAVIRKLLPFSAELAEAWSVRRRLAKYYDSFQWAKLTWFGAGIAAYTLLSPERSAFAIALAAFCIMAGSIGIVRWRSVRSDERLPKPVARKIKSPPLQPGSGPSQPAKATAGSKLSDVRAS